MNQMVSFRRMQDGSREDYLLLDQSERDYAVGLPDRVLEALRRLDHSLAGYHVSRLGHSLQVATRALIDGADDELIVAALIHDIGDELAPYNHAEFAAAIIRPYVRAEVSWIVEQHGLFQNYYYVHHLGGDRNGRDRFKDHPWYRLRGVLRALGSGVIRSGLPSQPLAAFEPLVRRIFGRPAHDPRYVSVLPSASPAPAADPRGA